MCCLFNGEMPNLANQDKLWGAYGQIVLEMENLIPLNFNRENDFKGQKKIPKIGNYLGSVTLTRVLFGAV